MLALTHKVVVRIRWEKKEKKKSSVIAKPLHKCKLWQLLRSE